MKYLALVIKLSLMFIGLCIMKLSYTGAPSADCLSGFAIFLIGLYLALQGRFGDCFSGCIFKKEVKKVEKKKGFFSK